MPKRSFLAALLLALTPFQVSAAAPTDTLLTPEIGGIKQVVRIQTHDIRRPVLLFLSGGPGSSMMSGTDRFTSRLIQKFTIVHWDQRDAGKTLTLNRSPERPTLAQMADDTIEVVKYLTRSLKQERIYLLGSSWGNVLGFHVLKTHPQLLHAYFAVNPVVSQLASEEELLRALTAHYEGNALARGELAQVKLPFESEQDLFYLRKWLFYKEGNLQAAGKEFEAGFLEWASAWLPVWNEVMKIDLRQTQAMAACPVFFLVGKNDLQTSAGIAVDYFQQLAAPRKELVLFEHSSHQIHREETDKFEATVIRLAGMK